MQGEEAEIPPSPERRKRWEGLKGQRRRRPAAQAGEERGGRKHPVRLWSDDLGIVFHYFLGNIDRKEANKFRDELKKEKERKAVEKKMKLEIAKKKKTESKGKDRGGGGGGKLKEEDEEKAG